MSTRFRLNIGRVNYHALRLQESDLAIGGRPRSRNGSTVFVSTQASDLAIGIVLAQLQEYDARYLRENEISVAK